MSTPGTAYARGAYFERRTMTLLRHGGYAVWQTRGSKGEADLIALKPGQVLLIQVKGGTAQLDHPDTSPISGTGWNALYWLARNLRAVPILADLEARGQIRLRRLTGEHLDGKRYWPCEPFILDEADHAATAQRAPIGGDYHAPTRQEHHPANGDGSPPR